MSEFFSYGKAETEYLKNRDRVLGAAIDEIGHINRAITPDIFAALVNAIVGQQISTKAQATVWARITERFAPLTPEAISAADAERLQSCGLSHRKVSYIKEIAESVLRDDTDLNKLSEESDGEVCRKLSALKGIGVWTAEMLMIFSMQRADIFSFGDLAILRGLRMLYRHRKITPALFEKYRRRYSPYATVASLYLWAIAGGACPHLSDPYARSKSTKKQA